MEKPNDIFEPLHKAVTKTKELLDNREPGLIAWNDFLRTAVIELQRSLMSLGVTPEAAGLVNNEEQKKGEKSQ